MLNLGCLERKKKRKTGGAEDLNGILPILSLCRNRECYFYVATVVLDRDRVLRPAHDRPGCAQQPWARG